VCKQQAGKTSNSALLQVLVGFLVGAVFVSVFTSGGHTGSEVSAQKHPAITLSKNTNLFASLPFCPPFLHARGNSIGPNL
jgi:hypothetical protein